MNPCQHPRSSLFAAPAPPSEHNHARYDALGNLLTVTQNAQASSGSQETRTKYAYDAMSRLTSETNPESGTKTYVYDTDSTMCGNGASTSYGDLLKTTDANNNCVMRYYDALHRLTDVGDVQECLRFRYDNTGGVLGSKPSGVSVSNTLGRMAEAETDTCASPITQSTILTDEWFSYTARGETSDSYESTRHSGTYYHVNQTYWPNRAPNVLSGNIGLPTLTYGVDGEGRTSTASASSGQNPVTSTTYNMYASPNQLTVAFGSGDSDVFTYDPNTMRMNKYQFNVGTQTVTGTLGWNSNSSLGSLNITDPFSTANTQNCSFAADDLARISQVSCGTIWGQNFSYDPFGNIQKSGISGTDGSSFAPTYASSPTTNRVASVGGVSATYDANGNSLNDTFRTFTWDADGNPLTIGSVSLTYDAYYRAVEQSVSRTTSQVVYSPAGVKLALMSGTTLTKAFVPLPGGATAVFTSSGLAYYRHTDQLGSSRFASTPTQTLYSDTAYSPFGEPYASSGAIDPSFTGQNQDTTAGLYDFLFREQDPNQTRWTRPDPAGLAAVDPSNPQSWNRYAYVLNNPLALVDPLGMDFCSGNSPYTTGGGSTNNLPTPDCIATGIPNYYDASYNGPPPTAQYLQNQTWQSVDTFFNNQGITEYVPIPTGLLNYNANQGDLGMLGSQEMGIGFKDIVNRMIADWNTTLLNDLMSWLLSTGGRSGRNVLADLSALDELKSWRSTGGVAAPPAPPCSMNAGLAMGVWKAQLLAWIKSHPGQQPPPWLAFPPSLSGVCG